MTAYAIANVHKIKDQEMYQEYAKLAGPNITQFQGKLVILGKEIDVLEGSWDGNQLVIFEFPSRSALDRWYQSDEYAPLLKMRKDSMIADIIVIDND